MNVFIKKYGMLDMDKIMQFWLEIPDQRACIGILMTKAKGEMPFKTAKANI